MVHVCTLWRPKRARRGDFLALYDLRNAFACPTFTSIDEVNAARVRPQELSYMLKRRRHGSSTIGTTEGERHFLSGTGSRQGDSVGPDDFLDAFGQAALSWQSGCRSCLGGYALVATLEGTTPRGTSPSLPLSTTSLRCMRSMDAPRRRHELPRRGEPPL